MTERRTLETDPPNLLMKMAEYSENKKLKVRILEDGSIFIDRDPKKFYHVLEYLRTKRLPGKDCKLTAEILKEEFNYYAIEFAEENCTNDHFWQLRKDNPIFQNAAIFLKEYWQSISEIIRSSIKLKLGWKSKKEEEGYFNFCAPSSILICIISLYSIQPQNKKLNLGQKEIEFKNCYTDNFFMALCELIEERYSIECLCRQYEYSFMVYAKIKRKL